MNDQPQTQPQPPPPEPSASSQPPPTAPAPALSSYRGRGRGRGRGSYSQPYGGHRNSTWIAPGLVRSSTPTNSSAAPTPVASTSKAIPIIHPKTGLPVGGFKNRSLVLNNPSPSPSASAPASAPSTPSEVTRSNTPQSTAGGVKEVLIDGVVFVSDARGKKLVRKAQTTDNSAGSATPDSPRSDSSTPKRATHSGVAYVRTKGGNLVSLAFLQQRKAALDKKQLEQKQHTLDRLVGVVKDVQPARDGTIGRGRGTARGRGSRGRGRGGSFAGRNGTKSKKLCRFFQKTGSCSNGLTCPYVHDSTKVSICALSLRSACPHGPSDCALSHVPNAHRSPHCAHFPNCRRGIACAYTHVHVSRDAPICRDFVEYGWCERGEACTERHAFECPEFAESGTCRRKGCKLPHVLRRRNGGKEEQMGEQDAGQGHKSRDTPKRDRDEDEDEDETEGISGARGRALKRAREESGLGGEADFVLLPLSEDEDEFDGEDNEEEEEEEELEDEDEDDGETEFVDADDDELESVSSFDDEAVEAQFAQSEQPQAGLELVSAQSPDDPSQSGSDSDDEGVANLLRGR